MGVEDLSTGSAGFFRRFNTFQNPYDSAAPSWPTQGLLNFFPIKKAGAILLRQSGIFG
jgi:hypothetical protein